MATSDTNQETAVKKKGSKKILWIALALLLALGGGGGAVWYLKFSQTDKDTAAHDKAPAVSHATPIFLQMDPYTVNLKPDGQFLQATFTLQMETEEEAAKVRMYMPQIRSRMLLMLSNKTVEELSTVEGKKMLITQIVALVEEPYQVGFGHTKVANVFITSFVIQ